jgi:mannose-1-phosphate guanylyltransferase/mannose-6-phosphate isomerase
VTLKANEGITIPIGTIHRIENTGGEAAELVEVQLGEYVGEDDIIRFDDDYGRVGNQSKAQSPKSKGRRNEPEI